MSSRASSPVAGPSSTPYPSRPFLHTLSPTSAANHETPPDLRKLEGVWRELRRAHVVSPVARDKGKAREVVPSQDDQENQPPHEPQSDSADSDDHRDATKIRGEPPSPRPSSRSGRSHKGPGLRVEQSPAPSIGQLRRPRFRHPGPTASSTVNGPPARQAAPPALRIPSTSSANSSDQGTHRTTSYTHRRSPPPVPPPPRSLSKVAPVQLVEPGPLEVEPSIDRLPLRPPLHNPSPSPVGSVRGSPRHLPNSATASSPLYTAHLPASYQPLKHGFVTINVDFGVRLVLRGRRWELSGDGLQLSYFSSLPPTSTRNTPPPIQTFASPFEALDSAHDRGRDPLGGSDLNQLHRKRLAFLRSYIAGVRAETVFSSLALSPSAFPAVSHRSPKDATVTLRIHDDPPEPSLTLIVSLPSSGSGEQDPPRVVVRWQSDGSVASRGKWEVQVFARPSTAAADEDQAGTTPVEQRTIEAASWAWEVLKVLKNRGVGERMWASWLDATSPATAPERTHASAHT